MFILSVSVILEFVVGNRIRFVLSSTRILDKTNSVTGLHNNAGS